MDKDKIIDNIEMSLYGFWEQLPEPKENYTIWFHSYRADIIQWLFSNTVEIPFFISDRLQKRNKRGGGIERKGEKDEKVILSASKGQN